VEHQRVHLAVERGIGICDLTSEIVRAVFEGVAPVYERKFALHKEVMGLLDGIWQRCAEAGPG
jgi:hypothetical protein